MAADGPARGCRVGRPEGGVARCGAAMPPMRPDAGTCAPPGFIIVWRSFVVRAGRGAGERMRLLQRRSQTVTCTKTPGHSAMRCEAALSNRRRLPRPSSRCVWPPVALAGCGTARVGADAVRGGWCVAANVAWRRCAAGAGWRRWHGQDHLCEAPQDRRVREEIRRSVRRPLPRWLHLGGHACADDAGTQ